MIMRTLPVTTTTFGVLAQVLLATVMQEVLGAVVHTIFSSGKHSCKAERSWSSTSPWPSWSISYQVDFGGALGGLDFSGVDPGELERDGDALLDRVVHTRGHVLLRAVLPRLRHLLALLPITNNICKHFRWEYFVIFIIIIASFFVIIVWNHHHLSRLTSRSLCTGRSGYIRTPPCQLVFSQQWWQLVNEQLSWCFWWYLSTYLHSSLGAPYLGWYSYVGWQTFSCKIMLTSLLS